MFQLEPADLGFSSEIVLEHQYDMDIKTIFK